MKFDYDALVVLAAVIRTGSFEAAAKALDVTQSAVSQRIKHLEENVGAILVVRGRPSVPTEEGLLLCQHYEQISLLQHELTARMSSDDGDEKFGAASIQIAVNSDSLATWFPKVVKRASDEINLRLEVIPDDQEFTEDLLRSGDALAIVTTNDKPIAGCRSIFLGSMDYMAVASRDYARRYLSNGIHLRSLSHAPSISFDRKDTLPEQWMLLAFGETPKLLAHQIPSYEGHLLCCRLGIGWAMMPAVTVAPLVKTGELIELVPKKRVHMSLYWQSRTQSSSLLLRLTDVVSDVASEELLADR